MKKIFLITAAIVLMAGCMKPIDIDIQQIEPKVVVNADVMADSAVAVRLTLSRFFLADGDFRQIDNATVSLAVNNNSPLSPSAQIGGNYSFSYVPTAGDTLTLRVSAPGHGEVKAQTVVPMPASVSGFKVTKMSDDDYEQKLQVRFTLNDDGSRDDYYFIRLWQVRYGIDTIRIDPENYVVDTLHFEDHLFFDCSDYDIVDQTNALALIEDDDRPYGELLFDDATINGQSHEVILNTAVYSYSYPDSDIRLEVITLSRDRYLYEKSVEAGDDDFEIFSEPVQIHCNVDGGIGLFSARTVKYYKWSLQ